MGNDSAFFGVGPGQMVGPGRHDRFPVHGLAGPDGGHGGSGLDVPPCASWRRRPAVGVNAYVLSLAALVAFGGKLGDRIGRVSTFRAGVLVFFVATAACGLAPNPTALIAARVAQGVGAALMWPASAAIMVSTVQLRERGRAMAMYAGISQVFLAAGRCWAAC
jgi:MFS family permease